MLKVLLSLTFFWIQGQALPITRNTWPENSPRTRLQLRCDSEAIAHEVVRSINFSLHFYLERRQSIRRLADAEALVYVELSDY